MLTINQFQQTYSIQNTKTHKNNHKPTHNKQTFSTKDNNIYFQALKSYEKVQSVMLAKAKACNKTSRPITKESASKEFNELFTEYKQDLHETSISDIDNSIKALEQIHPKNKILSTMQQATQFASIKSIKHIVTRLNKDNIGMIGDVSNTNQPEFTKNNFGLNMTLHYLIQKKKMGDLSGNNNAIFLDKNKLAQLKKNSIKNPSNIESLIKNPQNKFYILSGFDNGINFLNRNKNLFENTKEIISKDNIDTDIINQAKELGIKPIIIKNTNKPTKENIYNQMRPEQMTKEELNAVIDASIINLFKIPNADTQSKVKTDTIKYLHNNLLVVSPESMSNGFANMHQNIIKYNKSINKSEKDLLFCIPDSEKSYGLINHQYQLTNDIDKNKFIDMETVLDNINSPKLKNKTIVFLDDCAISGNSMTDNFFPFTEKMDNINQQNINFIYAPLLITTKGSNKIQEVLNKNNRKQDKILFHKQINNDWEKDIKNPNLLSHVLGKTAFGTQWQYNEKPCVIFPYMAPDNNCSFAANIALLHNINHNKCKTNDYIHRIKSATITTFSISKLSKELLEECNNAIY